MKRFKQIFAIGVFSLMVLALPSIASAQWRDRDRDRDDDYYGNARYNRNMNATIQNLRNRARNFERVTNRIEDRRDDRDDRWGRRGNWGGNYGRIEDLADRFAKATDRLAKEYRNDRDLRDSRNEARRVLDIANDIENELRNTRDRNLERQWSQIRYDLRALSSYYGSGGYNNRYPTNRNGDWRNRVPFPLPF
ncbi:MAG: hypothetical protein QUS14_11225 [Pyrinomonadaceae bacterium]|nr:hypothetical protein [Pyrinomonadaceae bacterium]